MSKQTNKARSFFSLFTLQSQNIFNDNAVRSLILFLFPLLIATQTDNKTTGANPETIVTLILMVPYVLLSPLTGWLADAFSKRTILIYSAWLQMIALSCLYFANFLQNIYVIYGCFALLALQSTLLSPAKQGIIPELFTKNRVPFFSGLLNMGHISAYLAGTLCISYWSNHLLNNEGKGAWQVAEYIIQIILFASPLALLCAYMLPKVKKYGNEPFQWRILYSHFQQVRAIFNYRPLRRTVIFISFFWAFGVVFQIVLYRVANANYHISEVPKIMGYYSLFPGLGTIIGSVVSSLIHRNRIYLSVALVSLVVLTISVAILTWLPVKSPVFFVGLFVTTFALVCFWMPCNAYFLIHCPKDKKGTILAGLNIFDTIVVIAFTIFFGLLKGIPYQGQIILFAIVSFVFLVLFIWLFFLPLLVRFISYFIRIRYRLFCHNMACLPKNRGFLLVGNHISYIDTVLIAFALQQPIRFLAFANVNTPPLLRLTFKLLNAITLDPKKPMVAFKEATKAIQQGDIICIYGEGEISRHGFLQPVQRGITILAKMSKAPVFSYYFSGLWGSFFTASEQGFFRRGAGSLRKRVLHLSFQPVIAINETSLGSILTHPQQMSMEQEVHYYFKKITHFTNNDIEHSLKQYFHYMPLLEQQALVYNALALTQTMTLTQGYIYVDSALPLSLQANLLLLVPQLTYCKVLRINFATIKKLPSHIEDETCILFCAKPYPILTKKILAKQRCYQCYDKAELLPKMTAEQPLYWPILIQQGQVVLVNTPHPSKGLSQSSFQSGWQENSYGRLMNGYNYCYNQQQKLAQLTAPFTTISLPVKWQFYKGFCQSSPIADSK